MSRLQSPLFVPALASISLVGPLAIHLYFPAIPAAKVALSLSDAQAQFAFSVALFCMSFATLAYGALSDRYGRRPLLLSGLCLFLLGSIVAFAAETFTALVAGRALQAIGAGCGVTLARTIASDVYGTARLIKAIAYLTMFYTLGSASSPLVGGILIDAFGWRSVFGFALVVGSVILITSYVAIPETRPDEHAARPSMLRSWLSLLADVRFAPFVLQGGFNTGTFLVAATAASALMRELLDRPSTEFGLYFLMFPLGFLSGSFIATRLSGKISNEKMVFAGSAMSLSVVVIQSAFLLSGYVSPIVLFLPGFFITLAQGMSLPFGQAGAISINPKLAGMAAGIGVFMQNFCGAAFAQLYGFLADGTPGPMMVTTAISGCLSVAVSAIPLALSRKRLLQKGDPK